MLLLSSRKALDIGLLVLRLGIGAAFIAHGLPKITGGPEMWAGLGGAMKNIGIGGGYQFFGLMAALAEFGGGIAILLGLLTRPAALALAFTMFVATMMHYGKGDGFKGASHAAEAMFVFIGIFVMGPGRLSLDQMLFGRFCRADESPDK